MTRNAAPALSLLVLLLVLLLLLVTPAPALAAAPPETLAAPQEGGEAKEETEPEKKKKKSFWKRMFTRSSDDAPSREAASRQDRRQQERLARQAGLHPSARQLGRVQQRLRISHLGNDPKVRRYLDLVDRGQATPAQLNSFANLLAEEGMRLEALEYYRQALSLTPENTALWVNLGTIQRQVGETAAAVAAYRKAIAIDPNNAIAHYNLGSAYDALNRYERAMEEYILAITIDPDLLDPAINPQVVHNDQLAAVSLMLYQRQAGSGVLQLLPLAGGELPEQ